MYIKLSFFDNLKEKNIDVGINHVLLEKHKLQYEYLKNLKENIIYSKIFQGYQNDLKENWHVK